MVRREFLDRMIDLAGSGRTVLLSSHQLAEVERVASHVALIHKGRLMLAEPLDHLRARTFLLALTFSGESHPTAPADHLPIQLVDAADAPRQAHWLVHAPDRASCEGIRAMPGVESLQVGVPNLEEIYIGYMKGRRPTRVGPAPEAVLA
jgi:ABC-2 type transport system ATP-binding protein